MINCNVCVYVYMGNAHLYLMLSFIVIIIIILHSSIRYKKYSNASWCRAQLGLIKCYITMLLPVLAFYWLKLCLDIATSKACLRIIYS
jgi:hypothetical protein